jgi:hypothetical protein
LNFTPKLMAAEPENSGAPGEMERSCPQFPPRCQQKCAILGKKGGNCGVFIDIPT